MPRLSLADRHEDWDERGHIAAHDVRHVRAYLVGLLQAPGLHRRRRRGGVRNGARRRRQQRQLRAQIQEFTMALLRHEMSFDKATRPHQEFALPQMVEPWNELDNSRFEKSTRFYKKEFLRVCDALELVPDAIRDPGTGCKASKRLAVFVLLRRWSGAEHW
eukprot:COSAG04_NODE_1633_length_6104_cov_3.956536_6_plen_161_part_00